MRSGDTVRLRFVLNEVDERTGSLERPLLAVSLHRGVTRRDEITMDEPRADDLRNYKQCRSGDLVVNRMRAFQGALGIAPEAGLVSPDYAVLRSTPRAELRFVSYLLRSPWGVAAMSARLRGIGGVTNGAVRTPRINVRDIGDIPVELPDIRGQRSIADFLDGESERISLLENAARALQQDAIEPALARFAKLTEAAPTGRVGYRYAVQLGKMLDEKRVDPDDLSPYLANANVQWDRFALDDLNKMTFSAADRVKYSLCAGDLLVCEGGEAGRAAVWGGERSGCFFQKALMRVRPREHDSTRYLMWCLRLAHFRGDFAAHGTGSAILHLPAERLIATRVPLPSPGRQASVTAEVDAINARALRIGNELRALQGSLAEYRDALITEAVIGNLDVTGLSDQQMDESARAAMEGERPEVLA